MTAHLNDDRFPERKISETLLHFAEPLLTLAGEEISEKYVRNVMTIAVCVWNCEVLREARPRDRHFAEQIQREMVADPMMRPMFRQLSERKRRHFAGDLRGVGDFKVRTVDGEIRLWAEARDVTRKRRS